MRKKVSVRTLVLGCILCLLAGGLLTFTGLLWAAGPEGVTLLQTQMRIKNRFVGDYDPALMQQAAGKAMVDSLGDRWSRYLTPQELKQLRTTRKNSYVGIGVTVSDEERGLLIAKVSPGGPAEKAGLQAGEIICAADGLAYASENWDELMEALRGEEGTSVTLEVLDQVGNVRTVEVTRGKVSSVTVRWEMLEGDVALLTISNFYTGAAKQMETCLEELQEAGARALIIDVRNDPGGYLKELSKILDMLLPEGEMFRTESYSGAVRVYTSDAACVDLPMAVLVNAYTYSAAELLAAQVQETVGAPLVGTRTVGKGYAQTLYPLWDGSAINLSDARYFTGSGRSLIGTGLTPDPYVEMSYTRQAELMMEELPREDDNQLQAALRVLEARSGT